MAVIFAGDSYSTKFNQTPKTSDGQTCIFVERENPIILTSREGLKPMSDQPFKFIHSTLCLVELTVELRDLVVVSTKTP